MKKGVIGIAGALAGAAVGAYTANSLSVKTVDMMEKKVDKFKGYYNMLNQWLLLKQEGKSLEQYFITHGYKTVAIYGMGEMGNHLYVELKGSEKVDVKYGIDKNADYTYSEIDIKNIEDELEEVDVIVVTATFAFDEIYEEIKDIVDGVIVSLDDVVFEV